MKTRRLISLLLAAVFLVSSAAMPALAASAAETEPAAAVAEENDMVSIRITAEGDLIYGGFADGKHFVSYGQDDAEELQCVGAPIILIVENGLCRIATDDERNYFYRVLVKD